MPKKATSVASKKRVRKGPTRKVLLTKEEKMNLIELAKQEAIEASKNVPKESSTKVSDIIAGLAKAIRADLPELSEDAVAEGVMKALKPAILGGDFVAPAPATITRHVRRAISPDG